MTRPRTHLPAGFVRQTSDGHTMDSATWARSHTRGMLVTFAWAIASTCELDHKTFTHEFRSIYWKG